MFHRVFAAMILLGLGSGLPPEGRAADGAPVPATDPSPADSLSFRLDLHPAGSSWDPSRPTLGLDLTLSSPSWLMPAPQTVQLSPFASTLHGADRGAYMGLAIGYLGNLAGLWPEKTAWYLMGAGAALGAGWGAAAGPVSIQVQPDFDTNH
jgi:hypothetical protein